MSEELDRERRGREHGILSNGDDKFIRGIVADELRRLTLRIVLAVAVAFCVQLFLATWSVRGYVSMIETNDEEIAELKKERKILQDVKVQEQQIGYLSSTLSQTNLLLTELGRSVSTLSTDVATLSERVKSQRGMQ